MFHVIITDKEIHEAFKPLSNPTIRYAARGIIIDENNKIALLNKVLKKEYKLPGGGIEENESPEEAFLREALEETGCQIEIIDKLGIMEERKSRDDFKQISHVFLGKVIKNLCYLQLTEKEKNEGAKVVWVHIDEAITLIKKSYSEIIGSPYESVYQSKFIVYRDKKILELYKKANQIGVV